MSINLQATNARLQSNKMKKRGQTFISSKLLTIILGIAVFFIGIAALNSSVLRLGSKAPSSYDNLLNAITTVKDGELVSLPLWVDEETAILAFNPGSDYLWFRTGTDYTGSEDDASALIVSDDLADWTFSSISDWLLLKVPVVNIVVILDKLTLDWSKKAFQIQYQPIFMKPAACGKTGTCVCLCKEFDVEALEAGWEAHRYYPKYSCSSLYKCKTFSDTKVVLSKKKHIDKFRVNVGGSIFERGLVLDINEDENEDLRLREAYVERKGGVVYVCDHYPCAEESIKVRAK